jgi:hypothetical protein
MAPSRSGLAAPARQRVGNVRAGDCGWPRCFVVANRRLRHLRQGVAWPRPQLASTGRQRHREGRDGTLRVYDLRSQQDAVARPMPPPAPVTSTTCLRRSDSAKVLKAAGQTMIMAAEIRNDCLIRMRRKRPACPLVPGEFPTTSGTPMPILDEIKRPDWASLSRLTIYWYPWGRIPPPECLTVSFAVSPFRGCLSPQITG